MTRNRICWSTVVYYTPFLSLVSDSISVDDENESQIFFDPQMISSAVKSMLTHE